MESFFDEQYQTPRWLTKKLSRRNALKSAAGVSALVSVQSTAWAFSADTQNQFEQSVKSDIRWQTLDAVFDHIFPKSSSGPSAQELQATFYLYLLVHEQPTEQDEIDFVFRGIGWLNSYTNNKLQANFIDLTAEQKELMLKGISRSQAGRNWLNMMILNLYEAMLSPPSYGGNPNGVGWKWLKHQAGFPLPESGQRYFELPQRSQVSKKAFQKIQSVDLLAHSFVKPHTKQSKGEKKS